jgi:hypothetical protein
MNNDRIQLLREAFSEDNFDVDQLIVYQEKIGIAAKHRTAFINGNSEKKKKVYYVEGTHRQMGYLMGRLAEYDISEMTTKFVDNVIWAFLEYHPGRIINKDYASNKKDMALWGTIREHLGNAIAELISQYSQGMRADIPQEYIEEMEGMLAGCLESNSHTKVNKNDLWVLNLGNDWLLAQVYTRFRDMKTIKKSLKNRFVEKAKPAIMCNGFSVFKDAAGGGHYFGRDFMFPTAGVFENTACMIIYNPITDGGEKYLPTVSLTAPGILGCISGMNINGVAVGINMCPSAACTPNDPGYNSLHLARHSIEKGPSAREAKNIMANAKRGVTWLYILADGAEDEACVVESAYSTKEISFTNYPPKRYIKKFLWFKPILPDKKFLEKHQTAKMENGLMVRWNDYRYDEEYLQFTRKAFNRFNKTLYSDALGKRGFINRTIKEKNCPFTFFFPPDRRTRDDVIIVTNHFVIPEMRYTAMDYLLSVIINDVTNDTQWRYDTINRLISEALADSENEGRKGLSYSQVKKILNFLSPSGQYPEYYGRNKKVIEGALSLFDLKQRTVESQYGYYGDEWIKLNLRNYIR